MISAILHAYGIDEPYTIEPLASGLINRTWKVAHGTRDFIVQQINHHVFKKPFDVAHNIRAIDNYLHEHSPDYLFVSPIPNINKEDIFYDEKQGYFRVFPFIKGSHTINVVRTPDEAFEAAFQFGTFTKLLGGFDVKKLHATIPDFHNLTLRYKQFEVAIEKGNPTRIKQSKHLIKAIKNQTIILTEFEKIKKNRAVKQRVTHHDTKISNVLFNDRNKGICVIDLDTIMPGYFISDVGDMFRTYLSPANEEETNFNEIVVRDDFFRAIVHGYISAMGDELTSVEHGLILYSGLFLTYMQAIRFLADYCNNDIYYGARYEEHNFVRAGNQLDLLNKLRGKTEVLQEIVDDELRSN